MGTVYGVFTVRFVLCIRPVQYTVGGVVLVVAPVMSWSVSSMRRMSEVCATTSLFTLSHIPPLLVLIFCPHIPSPLLPYFIRSVLFSFFPPIVPSFVPFPLFFPLPLPCPLLGLCSLCVRCQRDGEGERGGVEHFPVGSRVPLPLNVHAIDVLFGARRTNVDGGDARLSPGTHHQLWLGGAGYWAHPSVGWGIGQNRERVNGDGGSDRRMRDCVGLCWCVPSVWE